MPDISSRSPIQDISLLTEDCKSVTPINEGWSDDEKYCVTREDGAKYLLRITPVARQEARRARFKVLQRGADLDIPMCQPIEFGTCGTGVYTFHSWIDGEDLEVILPDLSHVDQYRMGSRAGEILRQIHSIPAPPTRKDWETRFNRKIDRNITQYRECAVKFDGAQYVLEYIDDNRHLLTGRPQCFQHGDYHVGNMMVEHGELVIIDFDRSDFGDPWEEFNRIVWCVQASSHFASGMVDAYFEGEPPSEFWGLLALYISSNTLSSIPWSIRFGQNDLDVMLDQAKEVLRWYDDMRNIVPTWYVPNLGVSPQD